MDLKFRAWDGSQMISTALDTNFGLSRFFGFVNESAVIMQWTGLTDKDSVEVFEGDIIVFDSTLIGGGITKGEVVWNDDLTLCGLGWHLWVIETNIPGCHAGFMGMRWLGEIAVIGNIHENKELLD